MSLQVITKAEQGYTHPPGNILDAATGIMALQNLPQSLQLQLKARQLANQQAQQNLAQQQYGFGQQKLDATRPGRSVLDSSYDPNASGKTQGSGDSLFPSDGIVDPKPGSPPITSDNGTPPANTSTTAGGSNDLNISGTSANENSGNLSQGMHTTLNTLSGMPSIGQMDYLNQPPSNSTHNNSNLPVVPFQKPTKGAKPIKLSDGTFAIPPANL